MTGLWLLYWLPVIAGENQFYVRDLTYYALPMKTFMMERLREGAFPWWSPYISGGLPFFAEPTHQVLYPFNLVMFLTPTLVHGISWFVLLHLLFAQFAFYALCRNLGFGKGLSFWGGLLYGYSGYVLSISDNVNYLPAVLWAPLGLALFIRGLKTGCLRDSMLTAICVSMMILAGDTFNPLFLGIFCLLLVVCRWRIQPLHAWTEGGSHRFAWGHLTLSFGVSGLLAGFQLLPTMELLKLSVRQEPLHYDEVTLWSLPPQRLIEFIQPYFYGSKYPTPHFIGQFMYPQFREPWADSIYLGVIPVALALLALLMRFRQSLFWILMVVVAVLIGLGASAPFDFKTLLSIFPPLNYHRYLEKMVLWSNLGLATLAVLGASLLLQKIEPWIQHFQQKPLAQRWGWTLGALAILTLFLIKIPIDLWIWAHALERSEEWGSHFYERGPHVAGLYGHWLLLVIPLALLPWLQRAWHQRYATALLTLAVLDLLWIHAGHVPQGRTELFAQRPTPAALEMILRDRPQGLIRILYDDKIEYSDRRDEPSIRQRIRQAYHLPDLLEDIFPHYWHYRFLYNQQRLLFNFGTLYHVSYLNGRFEPLQQKRHKTMDEVLLQHNPILLPALSATSYIVTSDTPVSDKWKPEEVELLGRSPEFNLRVLKVKNALPRVYLAPGAIYNPRPEAVFKILTQDFLQYDYRSQVEIAADHPNRPPGVAPPPLDPKAQARIVRDAYETIDIEVDSPYASQDTHLVLAEAMFPGWEATLDGKPVPILLANQRFMAIKMPPGKHQVTFQYRPTQAIPGLLVSLLGLLVVTGMFVIPKTRITFR